MASWLENLKVGDKVIVCGMHSRCCCTVERTTKTLVVVDFLRYSRHHGCVVGYGPNVVSHLEQWAPEVEASIEKVDDGTA